MTGLYPDVAKADRISRTFDGKTIRAKWVGSKCQRCGCVIRRGDTIVWHYTAGAAHLPGDCPPHEQRAASQEWADTLLYERQVLRAIPHPQPLTVVFRLDEIEEELAAGWPGPE